ncbi:mechanosensitive ion channel [Gammaproteobacteria bacterium]|nr:mechanosensitive ion channel [Gammaproteobacteria bacterium]
MLRWRASYCRVKVSALLTHRIYIFAFFLLLTIGLTPVVSYAQSVTAPEAGVTAEILEGRIQEVEASPALDEANKSGLLDLYRKSLGLINQRQSYESRALEFTRVRETAPKQASILRGQLEQLEALPALTLPAALAKKSLPQLERQLLSEKANLSGLRAKLTESGALLEAQSLRAQQVRERLDQARLRQTEISEEIKVPTTPGQSQRLAEAKLWALQFETRTLAAETDMLNQELLSQPMRIELYSVQRANASREWDRQQRYVELIGALVGERRVSDAETAQLEAEAIERKTFGKHQFVQELAQNNTRLTEDLNQLAAQVDRISSDEAVVTDQTKHFSANFGLARQKLEIAGLSQALGQALLQQRNTLPRARDFRSAEKQRQQLVVESSLRQIRHQQERARLADVDTYIDDIVGSLSSSWQTWIRGEIRELALQRRDLLDKAIAADDRLLQALSELDFAQRELSKVVVDYNQFLDERLLWVRTGDSLSWEAMASIGQTLGIFVAADNWLDLWNALVRPQFFPWVLLLGLFLFAFLMMRKAALLRALGRSGRKVGQLRHDRFHHSIRTLLITLVLALPWPILFTALGLHLQLSQSLEGIDLDQHIYQVADWSGQFVPSIGSAFYEIALYAFYFLAFRAFCDRRGLALVHFHWNFASTELLRRETLRLMVVFLPTVFLFVAAIKYDPAALAGGFSRLLFCVLVIAMAWFFGRILSPTNGVLCGFYRNNPGHLLTLSRYLWLAFGLLLPFSLAAFALAGYVYTATQLGELLMKTLWLIVAIILIDQLVVRWILLLERQLEFKDALERHRAARAAREAQEGDGLSMDSPEEPEIDFGALSEDTKKLINSALMVLSVFGMWAIWSGVLPAFRILDEVSLWSYSSSENGVAQLVPVTLGNVTTGLLIIVLGTIAALRLPALMEIALFARFNITAGSRYAISKLTQYSIVAILIMMVFSVLGGRWGEIQWLVAALGVGIGFGLQEIIANFISGLILLFERPIRIGDIVTVGETSGVVTKIRIRSTTIRNWDQQELLVPNKEFITGRLLNWTLTDPVARIMISVGIAYGSDVERAMKIILSSALQHERVLEDIPPLVTFESFGDNSLDIKLRCYIGSMDYRLETLSELNLYINRELDAAGIVIAFPQRDIHLDTSQPLEVNLHRLKHESD